MHWWLVADKLVVVLAMLAVPCLHWGGMLCQARSAERCGCTTAALDSYSAQHCPPHRLLRLICPPHRCCTVSPRISPQVQGMLRAAGRSDVSVEIVFPVSPEAITTDKQAGAAQVRWAICEAGGLHGWHAADCEERG